MINSKFCARKFGIHNRQQIITLIFACCWRTRKKPNQLRPESFVVTYFDIPRVAVLPGVCGFKQQLKAGLGENCVALLGWRDVLFADFVLKCDCSLRTIFFVTGRFRFWICLGQMRNCPLVRHGPLYNGELLSIIQPWFTHHGQVGVWTKWFWRHKTSWRSQAARRLRLQRHRGEIL